jgi:glycine hydroxymethyltransferase
MTTQGFEPDEAAEVADLIARALRHRSDEAALAGVESRVRELAAAHPPYPEGFAGHV